MADGYIKREDAMEYLGKGLCVVDWLMLEEKIEHIPAADVRPVVHARWIERGYGDGDAYYECSHCGEAWMLVAGTPKENNMAFCNRCGAQMDADMREAPHA